MRNRSRTPTSRRRGRPTAVATGLALASTVLSGCFLWTTAGEGDELASQVSDQEDRIQALEDNMRADREALAQSVGQARAKVAELEEVLERATKVVTRNSADLGLQVQQLQEQIQGLEGQIAEVRNQMRQQGEQLEEQRQDLEKQIQKVAEKAGVDITLEESEIPTDRSAHYAAAEQAYQGGQHPRARALFREYVTRYPDDDRADDAQYWIGSSYLQQDRPGTALSELRKVITEYAQGDVVDDTLLDMADAFFRLNACGDAEAALQTLIRRHPRSSLIRRARAKLREVQNAPPDRCRDD